MPKIFTSGFILALYANIALAEGLLGVSNPAKNEQSLGAYGEIEAFEGRDHNQLNDKWPRTLGSKDPNISILFARAEMGVQWHDWRLGVLHRGDALMYATRDAANLAQQNANSSGYDANRTYTINYRIRGFEATGLKMSKSLEIPMGSTSWGTAWQLRGGVGVSVLRGKQLKQETISGSIVTSSTTDFTGNARQYTANSAINTADPNVFNAPYGKQLPFSGEGYAVDAGLVLKHEPTGALIEFAIADVAGSMDWYNVPNYDAALNTANKFYDANGYANFNPTATSISSYRNIHQTLDPKIRLAATYPWGAWQLQAAADHTQGYSFLQTGVGYRITPNWLLQADYDWHYSTIGLGVKHPNFDLMLRSDSTQFDAAKAFGLQAKIHFSL